MTLAVDGDASPRRRPPTRPPSDLLPAGPDGRATDDPVTGARVGALRAAALRSTVVPGIAAVYAAATPDGPNRPLLVSVAGALVVLGVAAWLVAGAVTRSTRRVPLSLAGVAAHLAGVALLTHLTGGIEGPLGVVIYFALPFLAVTVPRPLFAALTTATVLAYWSVALTSAPVPVGRALVHTSGFLGLSLLCAAHAGQLRATQRRLTEVARQDPLTGCLNRRGLDERLGAEVSRAGRTGDPVTLVMCDLDSFKAVNDTYGHQAGDELLSWVGRTLRSTGRASDVVGRLGGDEFAVVLVDTDADEAATAVGRLAAALGDRCPASFGHATFPVDGTEVEQLALTADRRLYAAKGARPTSPAPATTPDDVLRRPAPPHRNAVDRDRDRITAVASMTSMNFLIGVAYCALFNDGPRATAALAVVGLAATLSLATLFGARVIARGRSTARVIGGHVAISYTLALVATVLDGGIESPMALGLLTPLPLVALSVAPRVAAPALVTASAAYLAVGVHDGDVDPWKVAVDVVGIIAISIACGLQGRAAARQRRQLSRLSRVDGLTDCLNRRGFEERFHAELAHTERGGDGLSLLLLDLDDFKAHNDTHGHAAGDELLQWVSATLTDLLRAHDALGRLGGDEFVALLTGCDADDATVIADRVVTVLAERTSVSVGTATLGSDGADFDALYHHADGDLYAAKATRRHPPRGVVSAS